MACESASGKILLGKCCKQVIPPKPQGHLNYSTIVATWTHIMAAAHIDFLPSSSTIISNWNALESMVDSDAEFVTCCTTKVSQITTRYNVDGGSPSITPPALVLQTCDSANRLPLTDNGRCLGTLGSFGRCTVGRFVGNLVAYPMSGIAVNGNSLLIVVGKVKYTWKDLESLPDRQQLYWEDQIVRSQGDIFSGNPCAIGGGGTLNSCIGPSGIYDILGDYAELALNYPFSTDADKTSQLGFVISNESLPGFLGTRMSMFRRSHTGWFSLDYC